MAGACIVTFPLTVAIQAEAFSEYLIDGLKIEPFCNKISFIIAKKLLGFTLTCKIKIFFSNIFFF